MIGDRDYRVNFPLPLGSSSVLPEFLAPLFWLVLIFKDITGGKLPFFYCIALVLLDYVAVEVVLILSIL